ncbi:MAG: hypothetical protein ACW9XH_07985 [Candidatus Nitrosopumilus sp. bin_32a]
MSQIENQVISLVLGYFSKINANVIEKNGLFDVEIPQEYSKMFGTTKLKITFDPKLSDSDDYVLVSPGSNILLSILNKCIDFGPVITTKLNSNKYNSNIIRFYFYVIFESINSKTKLIHVDVNVNNKKIIMIDDSEINWNYSNVNMKIRPEIIDDCYVESIIYLEHNLLKSDIINFKNDMLHLKQEELDNVTLEYKKRNKEIQDKFTILRSKGESGIALENLIDENETTHNEEINIRENLDKKYAIVIDFALIASVII